jgi:16S rRNA (guanine527-N7)-methyltransferase
MAELTNQQIAEELAPYGVAATDLLIRKIRAYINLLNRWNKRTSLTTVNDPLETIRFHFGESIFAAGKVPIQNGRLADVGSGAGFPGMPLLLAVPGLEVTLIESNAKKCAFLSEVVREIGGSDFKVHQGRATEPDVRCRVFRGRAEEFPEGPARFDFVTVRAVGDIPSVLNWASVRLNAAGKVVLWLSQAGIDSLRSDFVWTWRDPDKIPGSARRFLLIGERNRR